MTREEALSQSLQLFKGNSALVLELGTGFGKSKIAIELANSLPRKGNMKILLLIAKRVHRQNWLDEIRKWGGLKNKPQLTIECYNSLHKHAGETFDMVICDEGHHLNSDLRKDAFLTLTIGKALFLSATFPRTLKDWLKYHFYCKFLTSSLQESIHDKVLPKPSIWLCPLELDNIKKTEVVELNPKAKGRIYEDDYKNISKYKFKNLHVRLKATERQYLYWLNSEILSKKIWYQRSGFNVAKLQWLNLCGKRLKYLAYCKNNMVYSLLKKLDKKRTLTFCSSIEQTEVLGKSCIHSKNKNAEFLLQKFNEGKINHITTCQVLNEGVNLVNCQYGIFANLNASTIISVQRTGRLLRHPHPVIIIPYYKDTREQEIMEEMLKDYDKSLIKIKKF